MDESGPLTRLAAHQAPPAGTLAHSLSCCSHRLRAPGKQSPFVLTKTQHIKSKKKEKEKEGIK